MTEDSNATQEQHVFRYRRKSRFQGATWTPPSMSADTVDGAYCKECRQRHGYKTMLVNYERTSQGRWRALWSCRKTGTVIEEMELGDAR